MRQIYAVFFSVLFLGERVFNNVAYNNVYAHI